MKDRTILAKKKMPHDSFMYWVLAKVEWGVHPWVIWRYNQQVDGYSSGTYFENIGEALEVFKDKGGYSVHR